MFTWDNDIHKSHTQTVVFVFTFFFCSRHCVQFSDCLCLCLTGWADMWEPKKMLKAYRRCPRKWNWTLILKNKNVCLKRKRDKRKLTTAKFWFEFWQILLINSEKCLLYHPAPESSSYCGFRATTHFCPENIRKSAKSPLLQNYSLTLYRKITIIHATVRIQIDPRYSSILFSLSICWVHVISYWIF